MNKASWLAALGALAIVGAAVAAAPTPDVKVARSGDSIVLTFPEGTMHRTVGWRVHNQVFHAILTRRLQMQHKFINSLALPHPLPCIFLGIRLMITSTLQITQKSKVFALEQLIQIPSRMMITS